MGDTHTKKNERGYLYGGVPALVRDRRFGSACTPQTLVTRFIFDINHAIIASGFVFNTCSDVESTIIYYFNYYLFINYFLQPRFEITN